MNSPELKFRRLLGEKMKGLWLMSWHEDREISPGIPDLHYVMNDDSTLFRVGWLELKAVDSELSNKTKIKIEPSQHQYITRWQSHMPIDFFIRIVDHVYLVDSQWHKVIPTFTDTKQMRGVSIDWFHIDHISTGLPALLKKITRVNHGGL